jgi:hypothetical protein
VIKTDGLAGVVRDGNLGLSIFADRLLPKPGALLKACDQLHVVSRSCRRPLSGRRQITPSLIDRGQINRLYWGMISRGKPELVVLLLLERAWAANKSDASAALDYLLRQVKSRLDRAATRATPLELLFCLTFSKGQPGSLGDELRLVYDSLYVFARDRPQSRGITEMRNGRFGRYIRALAEIYGNLRIVERQRAFGATVCWDESQYCEVDGDRALGPASSPESEAKKDYARWVLRHISSLLHEAGTRSHQLHLLLKARGMEPKHHAYMIKNRGYPVDDPEFYQHFHPVEDLLKFIQDPHANDDPQDVTIGEQFTFKIYTRRWGHDDTYRITRTATGWNIDFHAIGDVCDKGGHPALFRNLDHDCVFYPSGLDGWMEWLWNHAAEKGLTKAQLQQGLDDLSAWIRITETSIPTGPTWKGYA